MICSISIELHLILTYGIPSTLMTEPMVWSVSHECFVLCVTPCSYLISSFYLEFSFTNVKNNILGATPEWIWSSHSRGTALLVFLKVCIFYACLICQTLGMFKFGKIPLDWDRATLSSKQLFANRYSDYQTES